MIILLKIIKFNLFFAQYCDGRNVKCDGLSQWGTVELANKGYSPIEILKYYYGNNINIVYNAPVGNNITTYPEFPVELGTSGDFVRMLKIQLNRIGRNYPAIPVITEDGPYFTIELAEAVRKFQEIFNLRVNGIVDKATWYKIKYIYNAVKKISELYSEGISIDEATLLYNTELKLGDSGQYINTLNYLLNVISYFDSSLPFLNLVGNTFTDNTKQVVMAFQDKYNLDVTGIVDRDTWVLIRRVYESTLRNIPKEYIANLNEFYPGRFLVKGMTGEVIVNLQKFLYIICEKTNSIPGVVVNGNFDNLTEQSVKSIQRKYNLDVTGVVSPVVWYKIVELSKEVS